MCNHKLFEESLEDVLEDVFGLPPRPQIGGHDGPGAASHPMETPKTGMRMGCVFKRVLWIGFLFARKISLECAAHLRRRAAPKITNNRRNIRFGPNCSKGTKNNYPKGFAQPRHRARVP